MASALRHAKWLKKKKQGIKTVDGKIIAVYELSVDDSDVACLQAWAAHFRQHYCLDVQIDRLRKGTGLSRSEYLTQLIFPDKTASFGPATRSGDFAEILVSDLVQHVYGFSVPRTRYGNKKVRNESPKGTDIVGFKLTSGDPENPSVDDVVLTFESKAQLKAKTATNRLQDAIAHSAKDKFRLAESLNAMKQRLLDLDDEEQASIVERFQDPLGRPFRLQAGAAAVYCSSLFDLNLMAATDASSHPDASSLLLVVVHGAEMMNLVHALYERAADEA